MWPPFCLEYNECIKDHNCHKDAECINTREEFYCKCKQGFQGSGTYCRGVYQIKWLSDESGRNVYICYGLLSYEI